MSLEIRKISIKNAFFSEENKIEDDILFIDYKALENIIREDRRIKDVKIDIARPGESVRIMPVKDVIEPRAKVDKEAFPGVFKEHVMEAGQGITYVFGGCSVVTTGPIVGFQEGLIDMCGPAAEYSIFSKNINIVLSITKISDIDQHEHEEVVRLAGLRAAEYLGKIGFNYKKYDSKNYDWNNLSNKYKEFDNLPKVVYIYNCMSQGLLHDTYFYGRDSKLIMPTILSPMEVMDGALVSGNCVSPGSKTTTYHHQNNAVIAECLKKHGKEINFIGIVLNPLMVTLKEKYRNCMYAAKLTEFLGADGAIISQEGFGNPTTDLMVTCQTLENKGIKTVIITNEDAGSDGMSESLPDSVAEANAIISTGNSNATILLPKMEKTLGKLSDLERVTGGNVDSIQSDGQILVEIHGIMGSHNLQGNTKLSAITI